MAIPCIGRLSLAQELGRRKRYQVAETEKSCFWEGELALTEFVVEDHDTGRIRIMLASSTAINTAIRLQKEKKLGGRLYQPIRRRR